MAKIKIPTSEYEVLKKIAELKEADFSALLDALGKTESSFINFDSPEDFKKLSSNVGALKPDDLKAILKTIVMLYAVKRGRRRSAEQLSEDIKETIEAESPEEFPSATSTIVKERLQKLLLIEKALHLTAKSLNVLTDQDHIFCGVKVLSDVRPVFNDAADSLAAAMIIHNLKISYHHEGRHKEFFAAMNMEDVRKIKEAMERAEKKSAALKSFIEKSGTPYFEDRE